jgi:hypothetical protein
MTHLIENNRTCQHRQTPAGGQHIDGRGSIDSIGFYLLMMIPPGEQVHTDPSLSISRPDMRLILCNHHSLKSVTSYVNRMELHVGEPKLGKLESAIISAK